VPGVTEAFVRLDAMVVPCWSGRAMERARPVGGGRHRHGRHVHPHARGESAPDRGAGDGDHRDPRHRSRRRAGARPQVIPFEAGKSRPAHKEDLQRQVVAKGPRGATGVDSPYGRTVPDMEGLERWITGDQGTARLISKVITRMTSHDYRSVPITGRRLLSGMPRFSVGKNHPFRSHLCAIARRTTITS
jgi:hypothetical protein